MTDLVEENETSTNEGDANGDIYKSFVNIEPIIHRNLDKIANKNFHKVACHTFEPESDFSLSNSIAFISKVKNKNCTFVETLK